MCDADHPQLRVVGDRRQLVDRGEHARVQLVTGREHRITLPAGEVVEEQRAADEIAGRPEGEIDVLVGLAHAANERLDRRLRGGVVPARERDERVRPVHARLAVGERARSERGRRDLELLVRERARQLDGLERSL